jgi:hypothetical protein
MTRGNNTGFGSAAVWLFCGGGEFLKFIRNLTESITAHRLNCTDTGIHNFHTQTVLLYLDIIKVFLFIHQLMQE